MPLHQILGTVFIVVVIVVSVYISEDGAEG